MKVILNTMRDGKDHSDSCTGFIIGKGVSSTGYPIFGRTEDLEVNHNKVYKIHKACEHKQGDVFMDVSYDETYGYTFTYPHDSYRYTSVSDTTPQYGEFDEAGFNEKGLAVDMTVSACANEKILEVDPYITSGDESHCAGISEASIASIVLATCNSAFDAVCTIAREVSVKGSSEGNCLTVADHKDVWYMELYSGHQFVAIKYPSNTFSVMPNTFWLNDVLLDLGEELEHYNISCNGKVVYSKGIKEVAKKAGTYLGHGDVMNLVGSYNPLYRGSNRSRAYSGIKHFNKDASVTMDSDVYEFLQTCDHKITVEDVMQFTRNRLENVDMVANDVDGVDTLYPIGNRNTLEGHIFVMNDGSCVEYPGVMYLAIGSPIISPYVAYYPNQVDMIQEVMDESNEYSDTSMYWAVMDVLHMVEVNRNEWMKIVNKELSLLQKQLLVDTSVQDELSVTQLNLKHARLSFEMVKKLQRMIKPLYDEYMQSHDYSVLKRIGKNGNMIFDGTRLIQEKGAYKSHLHIGIKEEPVCVKVLDPYGNVVSDLKKIVIIELPSKEAYDLVTNKDEDPMIKFVVKE